MDGYSNTPFSPGEDIPVELGSELVPLTKKVHLTPEEYGIIVQRVFLPFMEALCGHNDRDYQNEVACGIAHSLLCGNGHILTILQARQCFEEGTVVVASDGNAYRIEESPNAFQTGERKQLYRVVGHGGYEVSNVTEEHVVFTERGEVAVRDLVPGDRLIVARKVAVWDNKQAWSARLCVNPRHGKFEQVEVEASADFCEVLGLLASDGYTRGIHDGRQSVKFTNTNEALVARYERLVEGVSGCSTRRVPKGKGWDVYARGRQPVSRFLQMLRCVEWDHGFPVSVFSTDEVRAFAFIRGVLEGDGCVLPSTVEISCGLDPVYAQYMKALLMKLGVRATIKSELMGSNTFIRLVISGRGNTHRLLAGVGYICGKQDSADRVLSTPEDPLRNDYGESWVEGDVTFETTRVLRVEPTRVSGRVFDREEPGIGWYLVGGVKVHNSGKSEVVARTVLTLGILIPKLVQIFSAEKIRRFNKGFRVGIYGPDYDKAAIIHGRIKDKAWSENAKAVYADPDIDIDPKEIKGLRFPNGFIVDLRTASAGARIEGHTYDLIVLDETQDVDDLIIDKSLRPMLATTHGSLIMLGTPAPRECAFKRQCLKNQEKDQDTGDWNKPYRRHYEFDWTYVAACLPAYMDHIKREAEDLGRDSDAFRMAYNLDWIDGRGRLFSSGDVHMNGITGSKMDRHPYESTQILFDYRGDMLSDSTGKPLTTRFLRPAAITTYDHTNSEQVFAIDYGKVNDSTVVTVGRVWWDAPEMVGDIPRYPIHINDWLVLDDMDYEQQYPRILDFLANYNVAYGINDATGVGDAVHERMAALLDKKGIALHPFKFSSESKSDLYKLFKQEWAAGRITYPAGQKAKMSRRTRFFIAQMTQLQKEFKGSTMVVRHPKGERYHDDFPDSCAMLVWAVNKIGRTPMAVNGTNPIYDDFWSHQNRWLRNPAPGGKSTPRGKRR